VLQVIEALSFKFVEAGHAIGFKQSPCTTSARWRLPIF
jgi:hypothetical protein